MRVLFAFLLLLPLSAIANDITISWDASETSGVTYNVYQNNLRVALTDQLTVTLTENDIEQTSGIWFVRAELGGIESDDSPTIIVPFGVANIHITMEFN